MSHRGPKRLKSPAMRNRFSELGIAGRKTGVKVTGDVPIDMDGLENVDAFFDRTSPVKPKVTPRARTSMQALQNMGKAASPTPMRGEQTMLGDLGTLDEVSDDEPGTDIHAESPTVATRRSASRRATMMPDSDTGLGWLKEARKGRRATMALATAKGASLIKSPVRRSPRPQTPRRQTPRPQTPRKQTPRKQLPASLMDTESEKDDDEDTPVNLSEEGEPGFDIEEPRAGSMDNEQPGAGEFRIDDTEDQFEETELEDFEATAPVDQTFDEEIVQDDNQGFGSDLDTQLDSIDPTSGNSPEPVVVNKEPASVKKPRGRPRKTPTTTTNGNGNGSKAPVDDKKEIRRSSRTSVQPLAFWRNEHIEYGYEQTSSGAHVPKVKNIVRVRKTAEEKNQARRRRLALGKQPLPSLRGIKRSELDLDDREKFFYYDDENYGFPVSSDRGCKFGPRPPKYLDNPSSVGQKRVRDEDEDDDDIIFEQQQHEVVRPDGGSLVKQEVALSRNSIEWVQLKDSRDKYRAGVGLYAEYSNGEVYANSGVLSVPVGGAKPMRQSFERTMFYLVTSGKVEVTIRGSVMQIGILGQFVIPSGNSYGIKNVGTHPAQLYFVQVSVNDVTGPPLPKALQHGGQEQDRQEQSDEEEDEEEDEEKDEGNDEDEDEDEDVVDEDMAGMDHLSDISEEL